MAEADPVAEGAADVGVTEDAAAVDAFAVEETLPWEAEHPEMAVLRRAAATTAADNAARFFSMSIRMIRSLSENRLRGRGLRSRAPPLSSGLILAGDARCVKHHIGQLGWRRATAAL
ncbi:hypothetical protein E4T87_03695 [Micrococcus aloeverae]|nr:hypothetical protein E4T87_03695 [Micrococcus aloeverae]